MPFSTSTVSASSSASASAMATRSSALRPVTSFSSLLFFFLALTALFASSAVADPTPECNRCLARCTATYEQFDSICFASGSAVCRNRQCTYDQTCKALCNKNGDCPAPVPQLCQDLRTTTTAAPCPTASAIIITSTVTTTETTTTTTTVSSCSITSTLGFGAAGGAAFPTPTDVLIAGYPSVPA